MTAALHAVAQNLEQIPRLLPACRRGSPRYGHFHSPMQSAELRRRRLPNEAVVYGI